MLIIQLPVLILFLSSRTEARSTYQLENIKSAVRKIEEAKINLEFARISQEESLGKLVHQLEEVFEEARNEAPKLNFNITPCLNTGTTALKNLDLESLRKCDCPSIFQRLNAEIKNFSDDSKIRSLDEEIVEKTAECYQITQSCLENRFHNLNLALTRIYRDFKKCSTVAANEL